MVADERFELSSPYGHWFLKPACIPFHQSARLDLFVVAPVGNAPTTLRVSDGCSTFELRCHILVKLLRIGLRIEAPKAPVLPLHYSKLFWLSEQDLNL